MTSDEVLLASINALAFPGGVEVSHESLFGNSITYDGNGVVVKAQAMTQVRLAFIHPRVEDLAMGVEHKMSPLHGR